MTKCDGSFLRNICNILLAKRPIIVPCIMTKISWTRNFPQVQESQMRRTLEDMFVIKFIVVSIHFF